MCDIILCLIVVVHRRDVVRVGELAAWIQAPIDGKWFDFKANDSKLVAYTLVYLYSDVEMVEDSNFLLM